MNSLDTNVVLRLLLGDVAQQESRSIDLLRRSKCYLTDAVLIEVIYVLEKVYKHPRVRIILLLRKLMTIDNLRCSEFILVEVLDLYRKQPTLSIIDCYAAVEAKITDNQLATFDKKLLKYGGSHMLEL